MADLITIGGELVTSGGDLAGQTYQQTALHEIAFHNTSGITSTGLVRFGVAFEDGDIPSGQTARVRIKDGANVRSHAIETTTYASGALRKATMVADIGTVTGSGSKTIEVYNAAGSPAASSFNASSWVSGSSDDLVCEIRTRTGSSSGSLGNLDTSLKTAFGTSSRIFTVANCDLFYRVWVWEKLSGEEHLTPIIHASWWLDTDGATVKSLELVPVLSQHWWVDDPFSTQQTKELQTYDATWKWGSTTLDSRSSLAHAYYNQWASLRPDDDAQHARPHWIDLGSTAMPTLRAVYTTASLNKIKSSWVIPPYDSSITPSADSYPTTYAPLGANGMSTTINSGGAHAERGLDPKQMTDLLCLQTEAAWRKARVAAQAGMTVYSHVRDHRTSADLGDTSMGLIPYVMSTLGAQSYSDLGLETSRAKSASNPGSLAHDAPVGGTGSMSGWDEGHAGNYAGMMAFLDGESYLFNAALDAVDQALVWDGWTSYTHNGGIVYINKAARVASLSIPATTYGTTLTPNGQERRWSFGLLARAHVLCPDADRHKGLLTNLTAHLANYYDDCLNGAGSYGGFPSGQKAYGHWYGTANQTGSPWMGNFSALGCYALAGVLPDGPTKTMFLDLAAQYCRQTIRAAEQGWYMYLNAYRAMVFTDSDLLTSPPTDGFWEVLDVSYDSSTDLFTFTESGLAGYGIATGYTLTAGDPVYVAFHDPLGLGSVSPPTGMSTGTRYYIQNVSDMTCRLSTDEAGTNLIDLTDSGDTAMAIHITSYEDTAILGENSTLIPTSDYPMAYARALINMAWANNSSELSQSQYNAVETWLAPFDHSGHTPWAMDGTIMRASA